MKVLLDVQDSNTLLTYSLWTDPMPIRVSPESGNPELAALTLVVSNPAGTATVSELEIELPVGAAAADLTPDLQGIKYSISYSGTDQWSIALDTAAGAFVATPSGEPPVAIAGEALTIRLWNIQVSPLVGTAVVQIAERAENDKNPKEWRAMTIAVAKFPDDFYFGGFAADKPTVQNGDTVDLTWTGSPNATYKMLWASQSQDVTKFRSWTSPRLTDTTTFFLQVSYQEQGQTVTMTFSLTVIVSQPDIVVRSLKVLTTTTLLGSVTVGAQDAVAPLTVTGDAALSGKLTVSGDATVNGVLTATSSLNSTGNTTLADATAQNLTTSGALTVGGALQALGGFVRLFNNPVAISGGTHTAPSDGFVVVFIDWAQNDSESRCTARVVGSVNGIKCAAIGGNTVTWVDDAMTDNIMWGAPSSFLMPVSKGASWNVYVDRRDGNNEDPPIWIWWMSLGAPAS